MSCASDCRTGLCGLLCALLGTIGLLGVFVGVLGGVHGWDPTCKGDFQCSSLLLSAEHGDYEVVRNVSSLSREQLKIPATNGMVYTCKYGHVELDGTCQKACDGTTRTAKCRCQTLEEAQSSLEEGARKSLYASIGVVILGIGCVINLSLSVSWFFDGPGMLHRSATEIVVVEEGRSVEGSSVVRQDDAQGLRDRLGRCFGTFLTYASIAGVMFMTLFCMPCFLLPRCNEPPRNDDASAVETTSPASSRSRDLERDIESEGHSSRSPSSNLSPSSLKKALESMRGRSQEAKKAHPKKMACMLWFFPCIGLGFAAWGMYQLLSEFDGKFYEHLETTVAAVGIIAFAVSAVILLYTTLKDHPMACLLRTVSAGCVLVPLVGVAGVVWSVIRMSSPGEVYHSCSMGHCIFGLC